MAKKSYAQKNQESLQTYGKSLYERRIERATSQGLTRSQGRGHARISKGESPISALRPRPVAPPKISKRIEHVDKGKVNKIVTTKTPRVVKKELDKLPDNARVYVRVWDKEKGRYVSVYKGNRNTPHGITVGELKNRVDAKSTSTGEEEDDTGSWGDDFYEAIGDDSGASSESEEDGGFISWGDGAYSQIQLVVLF